MTPFVFPISVAGFADPSWQKVLKLPRAVKQVTDIQFYWFNLPASSRIELWLQGQAVPNLVSNPGNFILAAFSLPSGGGKNAMTNREVLCQSLPTGLSHAVFTLSNASPGQKGLTAMIGFMA